jgi:hypothetical protein
VVNNFTIDFTDTFTTIALGWGIYVSLVVKSIGEIDGENVRHSSTSVLYQETGHDNWRLQEKCSRMENGRLIALINTTNST